MQAVFEVLGRQTKFILAADTTHDVWTEIVRITKFHSRQERLEWDLFRLPHHCSYLSLAPDKGKDETVPIEAVPWIFEEQDQPGAIVVSTSDSIPTEDTDQPPHRQAANYYRDNPNGRTFVVTMEHPKPSAPEPLVITIDHREATIKKRAIAASVAVTSVSAPRAGAGAPRS